LPALTLFLVLSGACVTDDTAIRNDISDVQKDLYKLKEDVRVMHRSSEQVKSRTDILGAMRESNVELNDKLSTFSRELQVLESRHDETKNLSDKRFNESKTDADVLRAQLISLENRIKELAERLVRLEGSGSAVVPPKAEGLKTAETVPARPEEKTESLRDVKTVYEEALKIFKDGNYKDARDKFNDIINKYPANSLTANAYFWIAETHYKENAFEDAIIKYQELLNKFPNSEKVPGAKLKQAFSFANINDVESARTILKQLIDAYPRTEEADAAKKKLDALMNPGKTETPKGAKPDASKEVKPAKAKSEPAKKNAP
jgi:tol-pal system protein YbgF